MEKSLTYADAGVDIDKANKLVESIKKIANTTNRAGVMGEIGGFGGLFSPNLSNYENPVLVSSTDGVGTKLKIAFMMDKHDTIGIDLVAMCINDIIVQGAKPLFFLDYLSLGTVTETVVSQIIKGVAKGCQLAGCALIGGETAEMPGLYQEGEYDMAGFSVGIVDNEKIIDGTFIRNGHKLIGVASSGLHSNGYSLVRKICFNVLKMEINSYIPELGKTIGEELLEPTKIYVEFIQGLLRDIPIHGLAHITGGGLEENIVRILPNACKIIIDENSWEQPPIFKLLQDAGNVEDKEMMRTFNCGIGMVLVVPDSAVSDVMFRSSALNTKTYLIGEVVNRQDSKSQIEWRK